MVAYSFIAAFLRARFDDSERGDGRVELLLVLAIVVFTAALVLVTLHDGNSNSTNNTGVGK